MALKHYNPTTPSQRQLILVDGRPFYKGKPVKALTEGLLQDRRVVTTMVASPPASSAAATSAPTVSSTSSVASSTSRPPSSGWNTTRTAPPLSRW